ncbi:hypothetical protein CWI36_1984p0020 [Hamiltosporidium magnivora]|uniref:Uncharacterized protein n=1 Tax=Hamiltosporidium magnivora TaxID=148818 RepID=A0A4Q9KWW9_9MICR|nr:hypothetical protein CWI36_1984p0020 [Hamiltosporidium magnivora]
MQLFVQSHSFLIFISSSIESFDQTIGKRVFRMESSGGEVEAEINTNNLKYKFVEHLISDSQPNPSKKTKRNRKAFEKKTGKKPIKKILPKEFVPRNSLTENAPTTIGLEISQIYNQIILTSTISLPQNNYNLSDKSNNYVLLTGCSLQPQSTINCNLINHQNLNIPILNEGHTTEQSHYAENQTCNIDNSIMNCDFFTKQAQSVITPINNHSHMTTSNERLL